MDPRLRVVVRLPLSELWDDEGQVPGSRGQDLDVDEVRACLRAGALGVVATIGEQLRWLGGVELLEWWKEEARPRLVDPRLAAWRLEDFPDERCWLASRWELDGGVLAVAFEEYH